MKNTFELVEIMAKSVLFKDHLTNAFDAIEVAANAITPTPQHMTALADKLDAGASDDIWYDAGDCDDKEGVEKIESTQLAMKEAAQVLRGIAAPAPLHVKVEVFGGVAYITECSDGVTVQIVDHDNEAH